MARQQRQLIALGAPLVLASLPTHAAGILTTIADQYQAASAGWMTAALTYALHLFYLLIGLELAVSAIGYLFSKDSLADVAAAFLIKLLGLLFFWVLIQEAPIWIPTIIQSFTQAGAAVGGVATLDPSGVFSQGIAVANMALQGVNNASVFRELALILVAEFAALIIVIAYAVMAAQLLVTLVESYIIIGGGVLMLGFAGSRWTGVFTERYLGYVVSVGIKLFVIYLIVGLGTTLAPRLMMVLAQATQQGLPQPSAYLDIMGGALVFMAVGWMVPALASSMMMGAPSLTLGAAVNTTSMLSAAVANAVVKGMRTAVSTTKQTTDAVAGAAKLTQAATTGVTEARQGGAALTAALGRTAGDISRAASQQFRDSVIRGTGRESAAAAERAAGAQAVQGWGRGTTLGNLTNRVYANRAVNPTTQTPGSAPNPAAAASSGQAGSPANAPGPRTAGAQGANQAQTLPPRRPLNRITPPPIPHDGGHGGGITIRFNLPE